MTHRRDRGFTLIEMLLALSIGAALHVVMFGGVRVGLAAWGRGEARSMALEHGRTLAQVLGRAVAGTYPYRGAPAEGVPVRIIFDGQPDRFTFVTVSPSIPAPVPITFTAVSVSRDDQGLAVRQLALPNLEPLDRVVPILVDSTVIAVRFRYLGEDTEAWKDRWDMTKEDSLPRAVEIVLATAVGGRAVEQPPLVVPIRTFTP
jgi:prepilin-type N-terminal cleavage/methylation domain-containing protein